MNPTKQAALSLLFTLNSDGAHLQKKGDSYHLTFRNVKKVTWFTTQPASQVGRIPADQFIQLWQEGYAFSQDAPNSAFIGVHIEHSKKKR